MLCYCGDYPDSACSKWSLASATCATAPRTALFILESRILDEPLTSGNRFCPTSHNWIPGPGDGAEEDEKIADDANS
jgi:hypothetical protein